MINDYPTKSPLFTITLSSRENAPEKATFTLTSSGVDMFGSATFFKYDKVFVLPSYHNALILETFA